MVEAALVPAVVMATAGRPDLVSQVVANLDGQTASHLVRVLSVPDSSSLPAHDPGIDRWTIVTGTRGLAAQRNAGLDSLASSTDIVFFFDDDSVVRSDYVENALEFFAGHPEVVGLTGRVLIDGATSGEVSQERAEEVLLQSEGTALTGLWRQCRELYGCNFAVRVSATQSVRFDGRLPLYSWLEDHDFARRLMLLGVLAKVDDCVIVHRAAASGGRQSHTRLGYSQMINPIYLWRKGSFPAWLAVWEIFRPTAKNLVRSLAGSESAWRRKRLKGNVMALADALRGRITPERITEIA